ncbi:MAG: alpha/beta fold hydrolase [Bacteroidales bacterium]|nr:alpha/beta fold hydrolase [Bacteroidales bacterium]
MIKRCITIPFTFETGPTLEAIDIVFHTSKPAPVPGEPVVWICHALTANSDPEDWWPSLVGPGKLFDTERMFIICANVPGSAYGSSGPRTINPKTGKPYYFSFPEVTVRDMAATNLAVLDFLGIGKVDLLIGSSIGGFQAIEMATIRPDSFAKAAFIATAPRISPWLSATAEAQRMALEADPSFRACGSLDGGAAGLRCARAQALISYRCFRGYGKTQSEADPDTLFAGRAASYERYQGEKLLRRGFDAYSYYYLCNALDSHNLGRGRGGVDAALSLIKAETLVIEVDTDMIFPPEEVRSWYRSIPNVTLGHISSDFGHDGFLLEYDQLTTYLKPLLCR